MSKTVAVLTANTASSSSLDCMVLGRVGPGRYRYRYFLGEKLKLADAAAPSATVTVEVWAPSLSCQASIV